MASGPKPLRNRRYRRADSRTSHTSRTNSASRPPAKRAPRKDQDPRFDVLLIGGGEDPPAPVPRVDEHSGADRAESLGVQDRFDPLPFYPLAVECGDAGKLAHARPGPYFGLMRRPPSTCRRLALLERRARTFLLHWIASGAVIDEAQQAAALDDEELAALAEAVERARLAGR